jgi:hypothetical protein
MASHPASPGFFSIAKFQTEIETLQDRGIKSQSTWEIRDADKDVRDHRGGSRYQNLDSNWRHQWHSNFVSHRANTYILCGFRGNVLEEAHGICAVE